MRQDEVEYLIPKLRLIARVAGDAIMAVYSREISKIQRKDDGSPVTEADLASHRVLESLLNPLLSECAVVSEEDAGSQAHRQPHGPFWPIDPLDGTKEFIAGNGEFTVNIALIENGRSVLGVVYAPAIDFLYWGGGGIGAFRCMGGQTVAIQVSASGSRGAYRVVASKSHLNDSTLSFINRLGEVNLIQAGSSLKFCRVAEGGAIFTPGWHRLGNGIPRHRKRFSRGRAGWS